MPLKSGRRCISRICQSPHQPLTEALLLTTNLPTLTPSFGGLIIPPSILTDPSGWAKLDLTTFHQQNSKPIRSPEITSFAQFLRTQHRRVGAIGFCYGGWAVFHLGAKPANPNSRPLVDCVSAVHPTWLTKEEMSSVGAPVQIVAPEKDHEFTEELKTYAVTEIAKLGVPFDYQYFPRMEHGFATRGDREDKEERRAVGRARRAAVAWLREWLVEGDQEKVEGCGETGEGAASLYP